MQAVLLAVSAALWLVGWFAYRRRVYRAVLEQRLSIGKGAAALGLLWAAAPLVYLIWEPETLPFVLVLSAVLFSVWTATTYFIFRLMGRGPFI